MRSKILAAEEGVNFEAIYYYTKFISELTYRFEHIFSFSQKKYAPLFENINQEYVAANLEKIINIFSSSTQLLNAILNEQTIKSAFHKIPMKKWRSILPDRELFPLIVFYDQNVENISQIWSEGDPYTLQTAISVFLNDAFPSVGQSNYPAELNIPTNKLNVLDKILNIILLLPFHFELDFVIQFIGENYSNKQDEYFAIIFDKHIKKNDSQLAWLEDLDFPVADKVLSAMKLTKIEIEYSILYTSSEKLKGTQVLEEYAKSLAIVQDRGQAALKLLDEVKLDEVNENDFLEERKKIINNEYNNRAIIARHVGLLNQYRDKNFSQNENKEIIARQMTVLARRIEAYKKLMLALNDGPDEEKRTKAFNWSPFLELYNNSDFRIKAGNVIFKMNWSMLSQYMFHPVDAAAYSLWSYVENINKDRLKSLNFFKKFKNHKFLTRILTDENCLSALQPDDFELIFENCFDRDDNATYHNRIILLKLLDQMYRNGCHWRSFKVCGVHIDSNLVAMLVSDVTSNLDEKNKLLKKLNILVDVAPELHSPNMNNNESLPKHLSYQMQESDISVAEHILFRKYRHIFINNPVLSDEKKEEQKVDAQESKSQPNIYFYQIPTTLMSPKVVFDSKGSLDNEGRVFVRELQNLIETYRPVAGKPLVFSGILNQGKNHYIPYFIYVGLDRSIQVICVNPSPQLNFSDQCGKQIVHAHLTHFFKKIVFPTRSCTVTDPNVTQQLRQRDCGFNSLTVHKDAYKSSTTAEPLLEINNGILSINTTRLSVNGNNKRVYDVLNDVYLYSPDVTKQSENNRRKWAKRLYRATKEYNIAKPSADPICVDTPLGFVSSRYSFSENIARQQNTDALDGLYTRIAILLGNIDDLRGAFVRSMYLPDKTSIVEERMWHRDPTLAADIAAAGETLGSMVRRVTEKNLENLYLVAITNCFDAYLARQEIISAKDINNKSQFLDNLVDNYLQEPKVSAFFSTLNARDKATSVRALKEKARYAFSGKLTEYHVRQVEKALQQDLDSALTADLKYNNTDLTLVEDVISTLIKTSDSRESFNYLLKEDLNRLSRIINVRIDLHLEKKAPEIEARLIFELEKFTIEYLASDHLDRIAMKTSGIILSQSLSFKQLFESYQGSQYAILHLKSKIYFFVQYQIEARLKEHQEKILMQQQEALELAQPPRVREYFNKCKNYYAFITLCKNKFNDSDFSHVNAKVFQRIEFEMKKNGELSIDDFASIEKYHKSLQTRFLEFVYLMVEETRNNNFAYRRLMLVLYHVFNLQPAIIGTILTNAEIQHVEIAVQESLETLENKVQNENYLLPGVENFSARLPCRVHISTNVPSVSAYSRITPLLLTQFIINLLKVSEEKIMSVTQKMLITAVNAIPADEKIKDDTPLSAEWCDQYIRPIFNSFVIHQERERVIVINRFLDALQRCHGCSNPLEQDMTTDPLRISDIENIYEIYRRRQSVLSDTNKCLTPTTIPVSNMKGNFFRKSDDMRKLKIAIKIIRTRHQIPNGNFSLNSDDFALLQDLTKQHQNVVAKKPSATDVDYMLLAKCIEAGMSRLQKTPTYQRGYAPM